MNDRIKDALRDAENALDDLRDELKTARIGSVDLEGDLADALSIEDARAAYDRAEGQGTEALATWARKYGRPAMDTLLSAVS